MASCIPGAWPAALWLVPACSSRLILLGPCCAAAMAATLAAAKHLKSRKEQRSNAGVTVAQGISKLSEMQKPDLLCRMSHHELHA